MNDQLDGANTDMELNYMLEMDKHNEQLKLL